MSLISLTSWPLRLPFTLLSGGLDRLSRRPRILTLSLEGGYPLYPKPKPLRPTPPGRRDVLRALEAAREDPRLKVILCRVGAMEGSWAELYALREGLVAATKAGKRTIAYVAAPDTRALWLATGAKEVWLAPHVPVMFTGLAAEVSFYGEALNRLGVRMDVTAAGRYKSAMEPYTRATPSPENREAIQTLLDDLFNRLVADMAAGRGLSEANIRAALDEAPLTPERAEALGLIDEIRPEESLEEHFIGDLCPFEDYEGRPKLLPKLKRRPRVALIEVHGVIRDGRHNDPEPSGATTRAVCDALAAAKADRRVAAVLLHIDSPGGSATASERMWRAVRDVREEKPVLAFLDGVAASGGYYIASAADEIIATPQTLTGSIGVIASKPVVGALLEGLGVHRARFERGARAGMFSLSRPYEADEREAMKTMLEAMYGLFLKRVSEGRGLSEADVDAVGEGRVWTGAQALDHQLVDALGGFSDALTRLRQRAKLKGRARGVTLFAPKRPLLQRLLPLRAQMDLLDLHARERILAWCPIQLT